LLSFRDMTTGRTTIDRRWQASHIRHLSEPVKITRSSGGPVHCNAGYVDCQVSDDEKRPIELILLKVDRYGGVLYPLRGYDRVLFLDASPVGLSEVPTFMIMGLDRAYHAHHFTFSFKFYLFLSRLSILTRDIDIANLSVCLSVTFRYQMKTA